jgi:nucleotide-binding universal stress UspA family protein
MGHRPEEGLPMGYTTILLHCDAGRTLAGRTQVAADLAGRFGAHVIGLHVRPRFETPMYTDGAMAMESLYDAYDKQVRAEEAEAAAIFKPAMKGDRIFGEWRVVGGYVDEAVSQAALGADLVIVGQADPENSRSATPPDLAEQVALRSGRPVLVVPHIGASTPPGERVMICWNDSREAVRAITGALPLLAKAQRVEMLIVDPPNATDEDRARNSGKEIAGWLGRHGVKAEIVRDAATAGEVGNAILSRAADHNVDLIVMGIYGHSRLREMVLGGASRTLLSSMTVPILMAH